MSKKLSSIWILSFIVMLSILSMRVEASAASQVVITAQDQTFTALDKNVPLGVKTVPASQLTYRSSAPEIISVDARGRVTALKAGTARIRIRAAATKGYSAASKTITVTVRRKRQTIDASDLTVAKGAVVSIGAQARTKLLYETADPDIAVVDADGFLTGKKVGTTELTITARKSPVYKKAVKTVTVTVTSASSKVRKLVKAAATAAYRGRPAGNGTWAVYVGNVKHGVYSCRNDRKMQAASLIKLFIMGTVYENYKSLSRAYGKETIDAQLQPMITVSSNEAANTLVKFLGNGNETKGMKRVTRYCKAHGYKYTSMGRMLLADNSNGDNYTSAGDCGRFLTSVYRSAKGLDQADESMPYAQEMFELLKAQTRRHKIPAMLPASVKVANKTGELYNVENDAAILYDTENGEDLVLVFMAEDLSSGGEARSYISRAALEIYNSTRG